MVVLGQVAGTPTIPLVFADNLKKGDGHKPPSTRDQRIARFVPIRIVLPADNVKEISLAECQFLRDPLRLVVVKRFDYLGNAVSHCQERVGSGTRRGEGSKKAANFNATGELAQGRNSLFSGVESQ